MQRVESLESKDGMEYGLVTISVICNAYVIDRSIAEGSVILICGVCASKGERTFSAILKTSLEHFAHRWSGKR